MLEAGFGQADITPPVGVPLSGFIARENRPSTGIDSALYVRALALRDGDCLYLLLSYDLLGLGMELEARIQAGLETALGAGFARQRCALTAVHSHSGPALGVLLGETPPHPDYLERLEAQSVLAAQEALRSLRPARLYAAERRLPGLTYNRRALLSDGRVSLAPQPDLPVVRRGPLDERMTILLWSDLSGRNLAGLVHYACHGVAVRSQAIGADIPGALAMRISQQLGAPCLFLQGSAGDVNPTAVTTGSAGLQTWIETALSHLQNLPDSFRPVQGEPVRAVARRLDLEFAGLPSPAEAQRSLEALLRIAAGDVTSPDLQATLLSFKNTMNAPPEVALDPRKARFTALALAEHARLVLAAAQPSQYTAPQSPAPQSLAPQPLRICVWRMGEFALAFLAGEVFTATGLKIRALSRQLSILPVSYLSPLVGYLPDAEALTLGGYEVDDAWRFYGQPAQFAADSETRLLEELGAIFQELQR